VAVQRDQQGSYLLVVGDDNIVERRNIVTGRRVGERIVVSSGLNPTDHVVVAGVQRAREGAEVDPQQQAPTAAPAQPAAEG
jgi:membrane fusion protein (multidrug efflux system)